MTSVLGNQMDGSPYPRTNGDNAALLARITVEPGKMHGAPCLRGMRFRVVDALDLLASGMSREEIFESYPGIEENDLRAAVLYARMQIVDDGVVYVAA